MPCHDRQAIPPIGMVAKLKVKLTMAVRNVLLLQDGIHQSCLIFFDSMKSIKGSYVHFIYRQRHGSDGLCLLKSDIHCVETTFPVSTQASDDNLHLPL